MGCSGGSAAYVEFGVALRSGLEGVLAGLSLALRSGAGPSSEGRSWTETRGGAEGRAGDYGGHGGCNWGGCAAQDAFVRKVLEWFDVRCSISRLAKLRGCVTERVMPQVARRACSAATSAVSTLCAPFVAVTRPDDPSTGYIPSHEPGTSCVSLQALLSLRSLTHSRSLLRVPPLTCAFRDRIDVMLLVKRATAPATSTPWP
jgi:hypothetical protein